jgi:hypothetical protein
MDEIKLASDLATIKANAQHTRETLDKMVCKIDSLVESKGKNSVYRKMTWLNFAGMVGAAGFNFWPKG